MKYYVYYSYEEWGRGYIGAKPGGSLDPENDGYFGSFKDKSFKPTRKIVLEVYETSEECIMAEVKLHEFFQVDINPHFVNLAKQTSSKFIRTGPHSDEAKQKMSETKQSRPDDVKQKVSEAQTGEKNHSFGKRWYNNGVIGVLSKTCPEGFVPGQLDETKRKKSESLKGRPKSDETKQKLSEINTGKTASDETKQKMSKNRKGKNWFNNGTIEVMNRVCPDGFVPGRLRKTKD
jgi:hypothetical protein